MKKLVLVVAMFMFVCGGSFLVNAQSSSETVITLPELSAANDTVVKDTVTKSEEPVKTELVAPSAFANDTVVKDTVSKEKPAEPIKE